MHSEQVIDVVCGAVITELKRFNVDDFCAVFKEFEGEGGAVEVPKEGIL